MGFFKKQEEKLAVRLLAWKYQRMNEQIPPIDLLETQAAKLVEDAHRIARERSKNVMEILKDLVEDIKKR
jgi:hypothetical protein